MANSRLLSAILAGGVIAAGFAAAPAWADEPGAEDIFAAVGTGEFSGALVGFTATGSTSQEASSKVITACENAGGLECTADEVTNDNLCIVSVAEDDTDVVAGGAGPTVDAAREDAFKRAAANKTPFGSTASVVVSACP